MKSTHLLYSHIIRGLFLFACFAKEVLKQNKAIIIFSKHFRE